MHQIYVCSLHFKSQFWNILQFAFKEWNEKMEYVDKFENLKKTFKYPISRGGKTIFQISMPFCAVSFKRFVLFLNWSLSPRQASSTRMIGMLEECKFKNHKFVWGKLIVTLKRQGRYYDIHDYLFSMASSGLSAAPVHLILIDIVCTREESML